MTRNVLMTPSRTRGENDSGKVFFYTDAFPVSYVPEAYELLLTNQTITFPDFRKGWAYQWQQWDGGSGNPRESAISVITIGPQEWGPSTMSPAPTVNLDEEVIGVVPTKADHILVQVNLTRTTVPDQINTRDIPVWFDEGNWVNADGGCLVVEHINPIVRMLYFRLAAADNGDGTRNVIMRRVMSTANQAIGFYRPGNDPDNEGWIYGGTYGSNKGFPVSERDTRGPTTDTVGSGGNYRQNGSNPAATDDNTDYESVYEGDIRIIAGYAGITDESVGADPNAPFPLYLGSMMSTQQNVTTFNTFDGGVVSIGDEATSRRIFVAVRGGHNNNTSDRNVTALSVNGVAATQRLARQGDNTLATTAVEIWEAEVPTATSLTSLSITWNGSFQTVVVEMWAVYNLTSGTPVASLSQQDWAASHSLATPAGQSVVIGIAGTVYNDYDNFLFNNEDPTDYTITLEFSWVSPANFSDFRPEVYAAGFQVANGETLSVEVAPGATTFSSPAAPWIVGVWQ
jgi:hypothetical protein